jgi:hypothetical protein
MGSDRVQNGRHTRAAAFDSLMMMNALAKMLVKLGLLQVLAGGADYLLDRLGIRIGQLPGDMAWRRKNVAVFFPLGTSLLLSVILSLIVYILSRLRR